MISPQELPIRFLRAGDGMDGVPEMIVLVTHPDSTSTFPREKSKRVLHHLAFRIEAEEYESLQDTFRAQGLEVRSGIHPVLKGVRTFYVDDPDGNEVECITHDPDHSDAEEQYLLVVAFAERPPRTRLISARRATRQERRGYEAKG